jgi:hypothetical protein
LSQFGLVWGIGFGGGAADAPGAATSTKATPMLIAAAVAIIRRLRFTIDSFPKANTDRRSLPVA